MASAARFRRATGDIAETQNSVSNTQLARPAAVQSDLSLTRSYADSRTSSARWEDFSRGPTAWYRGRGTLLLHKPQSPETAVIIQALDTLRCEHVEEEWFRHLPAYYGHTPALDLAVEALVQASAYARGEPEVKSGACFQALSSALSAVQASLTNSYEQATDDMLAATALLAPFEGTIKRNGVPSRLHIEGLAAVVAARSNAQAITQLARDIIDWYAAESCVMACIHGIPSPLESIPQAYYASDGKSYGESDAAQLKALGNELSVHMPRLVNLLRTLRKQPSPQYELLVNAYEISQSLLQLQDPLVEKRFMLYITDRPSDSFDPGPDCAQRLHFPSARDYEALACYWQARLSLLRLERHLYGLFASPEGLTGSTDSQTTPLPLNFGPRTEEMSRLARHLVTAAENAPALPLFKQQHLLAHSMIVVWGATMDAGVEVSTQTTDSLPELLLYKVNRSLNTKPWFTSEDMNEAAEMFIGGEPGGKLAKFYGF